MPIKQRLKSVRCIFCVLVLTLLCGAVALGDETSPGEELLNRVDGANGENLLEASPPQTSMPTIEDFLSVVDKATEENQQEWTTPVKMVIIFAGLAILPTLLIMMTSFTRIIIVLSFTRRALSTQTIPPTIAMVGLALFLTFYTMSPTFTKINEEAIKTYMAEEIDFQTAAKLSSDIMKEFMLRQCREPDLQLFVDMSKTPLPSEPQELGLHVVVPAFVISEFRTAFEIGCLLFIPFLLIDICIAGVLLSAGMMMLPPVMISLPIKLILFILVDGWTLLAKSLSLSFN